MKTFLKVSFIYVSFLCITSCVVKKQITPPSRYDSQTVARLSKQFGIRLTQADNLKLYQACSGWLGVKYRYGGNTKKGIDCSGLTTIIYRQVYAIDIERNTAHILKKNCVSVTRNNLHEGDLVFFRTGGSANSRTPTHVGIYLKNGKFIHASSSKGVMVSSLSEPYYVRNWFTGGKVKK